MYMTPPFVAHPTYKSTRTKSIRFGGAQPALWLGKQIAIVPVKLPLLFMRSVNLPAVS
jgi:hypothetical protein